MSMLAGPRYKQKISIDPRNKTWSNDSSKFGQKMLEKMGWSEGKGLGMNEDGSQKHVKVTLKNNTRGLGCTPTQEDNWIAHQDDFNDILQALNQNHSSGGGGSEPTSGTATPHNLEERSKKSRSRVHYKRFTRGKDLSKCGVNDLNSIFGKRGSTSAPSTPLSKSEPGSEDNSEKDEKDSSHGVTTITNKSSVQEYFAQKMAKLQAERVANNLANGDNEVEMVTNKRKIEDEIEVEEGSVERRKKKKRKSKKKEGGVLEDKKGDNDTKDDDSMVNGFSIGESDCAKNEFICDVTDGQEPKKKKKKKRTVKVDEEEMNIKAGMEETRYEDLDHHRKQKKKKKKKSK